MRVRDYIKNKRKSFVRFMNGYCFLIDTMWKADPLSAMVWIPIVDIYYIIYHQEICALLDHEGENT